MIKFGHKFAEIGYGLGARSEENLIKIGNDVAEELLREVRRDCKTGIEDFNAKYASKGVQVYVKSNGFRKNILVDKY